MLCSITIEYPAGSENEELVEPQGDESLATKIDAVEVFWRVIDECRVKQQVGAIIRLYVDNMITISHDITQIETELTADEEAELDSVADMVETFAMLLNRDPDELWKRVEETIDEELGKQPDTLH